MNLTRIRPADIFLCHCGACRRGVSARVPCSPSEASRRQKGAIPPSIYAKNFPYSQGTDSNIDKWQTSMLMPIMEQVPTSYFDLQQSVSMSCNSWIGLIERPNFAA